MNQLVNIKFILEFLMKQQPTRNEMKYFTKYLENISKEFMDISFKI